MNLHFSISIDLVIFFQATGLPLRHLRRGPHAEEHGHCQIREPDAGSGTCAMIGLI